MSLIEASQKRRKERIQILKKFLESNVDSRVKEVIARFGIEYGIREEKAYEYLRTLVNAGVVTIENGVIKKVEG